VAQSSTVRRAVRPAAKGRGRRRLKIALSCFYVLLIVGLIGGGYFWMQRLNEAAALMPRLPEIMRETISKPTVIVTTDGKPLFRMQTEFREPVRIDKVPKRVIDATLAAEDKRFYDHTGIDVVGLARAAMTTASGRRVEGGSTITMQLAKRVYTSPERSFDRKVKDMALAYQIERRLTKDQILELYMNNVYYGAGAYGVSAAADVFFGKELDQLTLAEAALLARCVRRPSDENPFVNLDVAVRNRNVVLRQLREANWIGEAEYQSAIKEPVKLRKDRGVVLGQKVAPYFVDYVLKQVREALPGVDVREGGYRIETTLDSRLQSYAEDAIESAVRRYSGYRVTTGAFLVLDDEGRILAMVGGADYDKNQFNVTVQGRRQPGSAFKPIVYAAAFETGALSPNGSVSNEPYYIRDDSGRRRAIKGGGKGGSVSVRSALARSINTPAVWAIDKVGPENAVRIAKSSFGLNDDLPAVVSLALGSGEVSMIEMAAAYSVFQNEGDRFVPFGLVRVIGPDGRTLVRNEPTWVRMCVSKETAEGTDMCLRAVVTGGTGRSAGVVTNARGKTGTTSDNKDAWFVGYTDRFVAAGWIANERRVGQRPVYDEMSSAVMGGDFVAPIWAKIMRKAQGIYPEKARSMRGGSIESVPVEPDEETDPAQTPGTGQASPGDPLDPVIGPDEVVPPLEDTRTEPTTTPDDDSPPGEMVSVEVCADSGLRATAYCPERVRRMFRAASAPKSRCTVHRPPGG
jgi:penicillin-binding protein 1A